MQTNATRNVFGAFATILLFVCSSPRVFAQGAAPITSSVVISKVPFTITKPGIYLMKSNRVLDNLNAVAITVKVSDVVIDLGGHVLSTTAPADETNNAVGIASTIVGNANVTIRNGELRGFIIGVNMGDSNAPAQGRLLLENLVLSQSGVSGLELSGAQVEVRNCSLRNTGSYGYTHRGAVFGIRIYGEVGRVHDCVLVDTLTAAAQSTYGIANNAISGVVANCTVRNPAAAKGAVGIYVVSGFAVANQVLNYTIGLEVDTGKYQDNLTNGCITPFSGGTAVGFNN